MKKLFSILLLFSCLNAWGQGDTARKLISIGINLPPLIGNTITLVSDINLKRKFALTASIGMMIDNKQTGGFIIQNWDGTSEHINSGEFVSFGLRYTLRKTSNQSYFFMVEIPTKLTT